jgi:3-hydroxybutyryl-CoA dehydratase
MLHGNGCRCELRGTRSLPCVRCWSMAFASWTFRRGVTVLMSDFLQGNLAVRINTVEIAPGYSFASELHLDEAEIARYSRFCGDTNPLHLDPDFAKTTRFKGIIASGPHVMSLFTGMVASHFSQISPMVGLEFGFKFLQPVRPGVLMTMRWVVSDMKVLSDKGKVFVDLDGEVSVGEQRLITGRGTILLSETI